MQHLIDLFDQHGPLLVFLNVFIEQLGAPIPAVPTLLVAGALSADGRVSGLAAWAFAVAGSSTANLCWYWAGRRYGQRVLALMCRVSISPDVCIRRTENIFARWGLASLLVARFVPGLSAIASPLAGSMGFPAGRFAVFDALGTTIWAALFIGLGLLLHRQVDAVIGSMSEIGGVALLVLLALLSLYISYRWIERQRLLRFVRTYRIEPEELRTLIDKGASPLIVDVRAASLRASDPRRIPGAVEAELTEIARLLKDESSDREIILYCACPNEASAAHAARILRRQGFTRARPLRGGLDGWMALAPSADAYSTTVRAHSA
ncbi:MAG: DedA family protein/thiosulfate sulfurtransferase GlpE [Rhodocyclaceae bacterium]